MFIPTIVIIALIIIALFYAEKYYPTSNFSLPSLAKPHINALKELVSSYSFEFKKDLIIKAKESLKEDCAVFESGRYKNGNYKENYYATMFSNKTSYRQEDIALTWALCAILDFNGSNSNSYEYEGLIKKAEKQLISKFNAGTCPEAIYECYTNSNNLIQKHIEDCTSDSKN